MISKRPLEQGIRSGLGEGQSKCGLVTRIPGYLLSEWYIPPTCAFANNFLVLLGIVVDRV